MGYGAAEWAVTSGRAPAAGKRKKSARRTGAKSKRGSAPRAKKRSKATRASKKKKTTRKRSTTRKQPKRASAKRTAKKRAPKKRAPKKVKAPKAKKYTRYDPYTGRKYSVTEDDPRFYEFLERKPSAVQRKANKLRAAPVDYITEEVQKDVAKRAARNVQTQVSRTTRNIATGVTGAVASSGAGRALSAALPALGTVGALAAAGILGGWLMDKAGDWGRVPSLGERSNQLSLNFVKAQQALQQKTGARTWQDVPEGPRTKLIADYKQALVELYKAGDRARYTPVRNF